MKIVKISDIIVGKNRQRREFDVVEIKELRDDIKANGLMHPPSVRMENGQVILVAGETRLKAISGLTIPYRCGEVDIPPDHVPVNDFGELTELQAEELELSENIRRKNLTWKEEADAWARLHILRKKTNPEQTKAQTVTELLSRPAYSQDVKKLGESLLIQEHADDPNVQKAKSQKEAVGFIQKKLAAVKAEAIALMVNSRNERHRVLQGDCKTQLTTLQDESVDCIVTDPPYGINAHKHGASSSSEAGYLHDYDDSPDNAFEIMNAIFQVGYQKTKAKAHIYMFLDFRFWTEVSELAKLHGWSPHPYPIIWSRGGGMVGDYRRTPQRAYDVILYANKGDRFVQKTSPDVIQIGMLDGAKRHHAAEKPVDLYHDLLSRSVSAGDVVLDPCCGAGPIFPAANRLGCFAIGIEFNPSLATISTSRFEEK